MRSIQKCLQTRHTIPAGLMLVAIGLTFVWSLPWLGFYWDDWLVVFHLQTSRYADLIRLYAFDRPLSAWTALLSGPLLGISPLGWQIFSLLLRAGAAYLLYRILDILLPRQRQFAVWTAILFALYPAYRLQPIAVAYSQHWISYAAFFLSIFFMIRAVREDGARIPNTIIALLLAFLHLATLEYFAGLELLRPVVLLLLSQPTLKGWSARWRQAALWWAPYLTLLVVWAIWRLFLLEFPVEPHPPVLLTGLRDQPLTTLLDWAQTALQSLVTVLAAAWGRVFDLDWIDLRDRFFWASTGLAMLAAAITFRLAQRLEVEHEEAGDPPFARAALIGLLALILGLAPAWVIGESPIEAGYNERFALPAMLGAALLVVGLVFHLVASKRQRSLVLAVLLGLAAWGHLRAAEAFRQDWQAQEHYFQQVAWRAPAIEPNTALLFYAPLTDFMPASSSSAALNAVYAQSRATEHVDYWYFDLELSRHVRKLENAKPLISNYRGMLFEAENGESNLYFYQPEGACLWLLSAMDEANPYLPDEVRTFAAYSNPDRITADTSRLNKSPIFDLGPAESWCYYYQQSARLSQLGRWEELIDSQNEARARGLKPNIAIEWLPLLEAYIHTGAWDSAQQLSVEIHASHARNDFMLCARWLALETVWASDEAGPGAWQAVNQLAECR